LAKKQADALGIFHAEFIRRAVRQQLPRQKEGPLEASIVGLIAQ
jgi:hypothetical protein